MDNVHTLVTRAKLGDDAAFSALVRRFHGPLTSTLARYTRDRSEAEELVQEAFLRAWLELPRLRHAPAFTSWLWRIGRHLALAWTRRHPRNPRQDEGDMDRHADPRSIATGDNRPAGELSWERLTEGLSPQDRTLLELRHQADLSINELCLVLDRGPSCIKSRLSRLHRRLARVQGSLGQKRRKDLKPAGQNKRLEEKVMDVMEMQKLGAHVFMRLSLAAQVDLVSEVEEGAPLSPATLSAIGQVDRGAAFLARYGTRLTLKEVIRILNKVDRFTETRLITELETAAPATAELIKQNMFVFEDFVLFDPQALHRLMDEADPDVLAAALSGADQITRQHFLASLDDAECRALEKRVADSPGGLGLAHGAQEALVHLAMEMEAAGRLKVRRGDEAPDGGIIISLA